MKKLLSITAISCLLSGCVGFTHLLNSNGNLNTYNQGNYTLNQKDKDDLGTIIGVFIICRNSKSKLVSEWHSLDLEGRSLTERLNPNDKGYINANAILMVYNPYITKKGMPKDVDSLVRVRIASEKNPRIIYEISMTAQKEYKLNCSRSDLSEATNRLKQISANVR